MAPVKQITTPRLELAAAVVAVKMDKIKELKFQLKESVFWTDSTTVLKYIENEKLRFQTFVANRIAVIRETTRPGQWRYVNTTINPADCASRGLKVEDFLNHKSWIQGLGFLLEPESHWPGRPDQFNHLAEDDLEVKKTVTVNVVCCRR